MSNRGKCAQCARLRAKLAVAVELPRALEIEGERDIALEDLAIARGALAEAEKTLDYLRMYMAIAKYSITDAVEYVVGAHDALRAALYVSPSDEPPAPPAEPAQRAKEQK